jgi:hypothetical protein
MNIFEIIATQRPIETIKGITREYAEGLEEPEWYQIVREAYVEFMKPGKDNFNMSNAAEGLEFINKFVSTLNIPLGPPEPPRPGVGVVMVNEGISHSCIITKTTTDKYYYIWDDGTPGEEFWGVFDSKLGKKRPATDEEIDSLFGVIQVSGGFKESTENHSGEVTSQKSIDVLLKRRGE